MMVVLFKAALTNSSVRMVFDTYILKSPVFGPILKKNIFANVSRTLALLMQAGTPILQAIEISGGVVGNKLYSKSMDFMPRDL